MRQLLEAGEEPCPFGIQSIDPILPQAADTGIEFHEHHVSIAVRLLISNVIIYLLMYCISIKILVHAVRMSFFAAVETELNEASIIVIQWL